MNVESAEENQCNHAERDQNKHEEAASPLNDQHEDPVDRKAECNPENCFFELILEVEKGGMIRIRETVSIFYVEYLVKIKPNAHCLGEKVVNNEEHCALFDVIDVRIN